MANSRGANELFQGTSGGFTMIPNMILDCLGFLSAREQIVLLYICRRTFGFRRLKDSISIEQFSSGVVKRDGTRLDAGTGLSHRTVQVALAELQSKRLIMITRNPGRTQQIEVNLGQLEQFQSRTRQELNASRAKTAQPESLQAVVTGVQDLPPQNKQERQMKERKQHIACTSEGRELLQNHGVREPVLSKLVNKYSVTRIRHVIRYVSEMKKVHSKAGAIVRALENNWDFETDEQCRSREKSDRQNQESDGRMAEMENLCLELRERVESAGNTSKERERVFSLLVEQLSVPTHFDPVRHYRWSRAETMAPFAAIVWEDSESSACKRQSPLLREAMHRVSQEFGARSMREFREYVETLGESWPRTEVGGA